LTKYHCSTSSYKRNPNYFSSLRILVYNTNLKLIFKKAPVIVLLVKENFTSLPLYLLQVLQWFPGTYIRAERLYP
jgi:hypothetical protein